ncbi:hypothetical protein EJB05_37305, partial [Eragrostis curvula]
MYFMATHSSSFIFLCLLLPAVVAMASPLNHIFDNPCNCPQQNETTLHMYLHQFPSWPNVTNPNEAYMTCGSAPIGFGTMIIHDWILTDGPDPNEKVFARAQGFHLQAGPTSTSWYTSHIFVFQNGSIFTPNNSKWASSWSWLGSTLEVLGMITPPNTAGQWAIMCGTGSFTNAHGTIKYNVVQSTMKNITEFVKKLDIHRVIHLNQTYAQRMDSAETHMHAQDVGDVVSDLLQKHGSIFRVDFIVFINRNDMILMCTDDVASQVHLSSRLFVQPSRVQHHLRRNERVGVDGEVRHWGELSCSVEEQSFSLWSCCVLEGMRRGGQSSFRCLSSPPVSACV